MRARSDALPTHPLRRLTRSGGDSCAARGPVRPPATRGAARARHPRRPRGPHSPCPLSLSRPSPPAPSVLLRRAHALRPTAAATHPPGGCGSAAGPSPSAFLRPHHVPHIPCRPSEPAAAQRRARARSPYAHCLLKAVTVLKVGIKPPQKRRRRGQRGAGRAARGWAGGGLQCAARARTRRLRSESASESAPVTCSEIKKHMIIEEI
jgi:hypothetical protein